jgi:hypothetical protein
MHSVEPIAFEEGLDMKKILVSLALVSAVAGCSTSAPPPAPTLPGTPDPAAIAASKVDAAGATKVGPAGRAGWCTYQTAAGGLYEAKC